MASSSSPPLRFILHTANAIKAKMAAPTPTQIPMIAPVGNLFPPLWVAAVEVAEAVAASADLVASSTDWVRMTVTS